MLLTVCVTLGFGKPVSGQHASLPARIRRGDGKLGNLRCVLSLNIVQPEEDNLHFRRLPASTCLQNFRLPLFGRTLVDSNKFFQHDLQSHLAPHQSVVLRSLGLRHYVKIHLLSTQQCQPCVFKRGGQDKAYPLLLTHTDVHVFEQSERLSSPF